MYKKKYQKYKNKYLNLKNKNKDKLNHNLIPIIVNYKYNTKVKSVNFNKLDDFKVTNNIDEVNKNKVFIIETIDQFDKFTNKYGFNPKPTTEIFIRWDKVKNDFFGFGIKDISGDLYKHRFWEAYLKNKLYGSWWRLEWYEDDFVIFE